MKLLQGAAVTIEAQTLQVDAAALVERFRARVTESVSARAKALADADIERPAVSVSGVDDVRAAAAIDVGNLALKEILEHADSGSASVTIPLRPQTLKAGPVSIAIEAGTAVVLDVSVSPGGIIERAATKGRLEPALKLPLGASVQGVSLDDNGAVVANLDRFPDLNLSMLALSGFVVPPTLGELVGVLFADRGDSADSGPGVVDVDGIVVLANDVVPKNSALVVGTALQIRSGSQTRLNVRYGHGKLHIDGVVDIAHASIRAPAFDVSDVSGRCHVDADLELGAEAGAFSLAVTALDVDVAHAHAALGTSEVSVAALAVGGAEVKVARVAAADGAAALAAPPPTFMVRCPQLRGRVLEGHVALSVGAMQVPIALRPGAATGSVVVSNKHHQLDLDVEDAGLVVGPVDVKVGVVDVRLDKAEAHGGGRLRAASDGVSFSGALAATVAVGEGRVDVGAAVLCCERGHGTITLHELSASQAGLEVLRVNAALELVMGQGSVPLLGTRLVLEAGARAHLGVDEVHYEQGSLPRASGSLTINAAGERCVIDEALLVVPRSAALAQIERCTLEGGQLTVHGLKAQVRTDEG